MNSLFDKLTEWIKEALIGGIPQQLLKVCVSKA